MEEKVTKGQGMLVGKDISRQDFLKASGAGLAGVLLLGVAGCGESEQTGSSVKSVGGVTIPTVSVRYGNAEFLDHTDAIIGVEKGWFEEVGINLQPEPAGSLHTPADHPAVMLADTVDVQSTNYQILLPALAETDKLRMFAYGDFFIGFALMGQPEFTSYSEFVDQGMSEQEAVEKAVGQLKGRTLTWSPDAAVRGFGRSVLSAGNLPLGEVNVESLNDAQGVQLMQSGRADFQIGGAPTRATLEQRGFKPIVTARDLTGIAQPPYQSAEELNTVSTNGWGTTVGYWEENQDTCMRMAGVKWRISKFIADNPEQAAEIHVPALNRVAGTDLDVKDGLTIYDSVDPYIPFEEQGELWFDPDKPTYELTMIAAAINSAVANDVLQEGDAQPEDVTIAHIVYKRAQDLKAEAEDLMAQAEEASPEGEAADLLEAARHHHGIYNYLDSSRFAQAAVDKL
jgi:ABC-type nitrate/sulfonate/bicarbonate transport system substrate-binding protein